MTKDTDIKLVCRQCGNQFLFTEAEQDFFRVKNFAQPSRCPECRTAHHSSRPVVCSQCGTEIEKESSRYCRACLDNAQMENEFKSKRTRMEASAAHSKMLASEAQRAELEEALRRKEQTISELMSKVDSLCEELDKERQVQSLVVSLQPVLDKIEERLGTVELTENKISERMLQLVQRMHELYDNISLLELVKRSLRSYQRQDAYQK